MQLLESSDDPAWHKLRSGSGAATPPSCRVMYLVPLGGGGVAAVPRVWYRVPGRRQLRVSSVHCGADYVLGDVLDAVLRQVGGWLF